jgi:hypothetical protein
MMPINIRQQAGTLMSAGGLPRTFGEKAGSPIRNFTVLALSFP